VPGNIVATEKNGAVFVPGLVIDSPDGARFLRGEVVETPDGPRLLPPDVKGDGKLEFCVQGFDINAEEARLFLGKSASSADIASAADLLGGVGGSTVASEALKALADGFDSAAKAVKVIADAGKSGEEPDVVLRQDFLDSFDGPHARKGIAAALTKVFAQVASNLGGGDGTEGVVNPDCEAAAASANRFAAGELKKVLSLSLLDSGKKLSPALEQLRHLLETKGASDAEDVLRLLAGIVTCSVPSALRDSQHQMDGSSPGQLDDRALAASLLDIVEDAVKEILADQGIVPRGRLDKDLKELVVLAKELGREDNASLLTAVAAAADARSGGKYLESLLQKVNSSPDGSIDLTDKVTDVADRLAAALGPKDKLAEAFREMADKDPDFVAEVLRYAAEESKSSAGADQADVLRRAVARAVDEACGRQLQELSEEDLQTMLVQAAGLARFLGQHSEADALLALTDDPVAMRAILTDGVSRDILKSV
jgi:hypothetical protein